MNREDWFLRGKSVYEIIGRLTPGFWLIWLAGIVVAARSRHLPFRDILTFRLKMSQQLFSLL